MFRIRTASIIGAEHQRKQGNSQDGFSSGSLSHNEIEYHWGIICDGCSAGLHSEVGARLLADFFCSEIPYLISAGSTLEEIPGQLYIAGLGYLRALASITAMGNPTARLEFIQHHLLCTVIGFVINDQQAVIFNAGDGVIIIDGVIERIEQENRPLYMAYHLLDKAMLRGLSEPLVLNFQIRTVTVGNFSRLAIASDGLEAGAISALWGHKHQLGLLRKLRVLRLEKVAIFSDDCTVITVEKIEGGEDDD